VLGRPVGFSDDYPGDDPVAESHPLANGSITVIENMRFHPGEEVNDPAFVAEMAKLGDLYVNDAFSAAHRAHASTEGLAHVLPAFAGRAMEAELKALEKALGAPEKPVAAVVGGAKVSSKLDVLKHLVVRVDHLIIGGGMANTFLAARGVENHCASMTWPPPPTASSTRRRAPAAPSICRMMSSSQRNSRPIR
jgi:phosphoglycerate kinase